MVKLPQDDQVNGSHDIRNANTGWFNIQTAICTACSLDAKRCGEYKGGCPVPHKEFITWLKRLQIPMWKSKPQNKNTGIGFIAKRVPELIDATSSKEEKINADYRGEERLLTQKGLEISLEEKQDLEIGVHLDEGKKQRKKTAKQSRGREQPTPGEAGVCGGE